MKGFLGMLHRVEVFLREAYRAISGLRLLGNERPWLLMMPFRTVIITVVLYSISDIVSTECSRFHGLKYNNWRLLGCG